MMKESFQKFSLVAGAQDHGHPFVLGDVMDMCHLMVMSVHICLSKTCGRMTTILNTYSSKEKSPCYGACVNMQICTIILWLHCLCKV
jgi:hypothetical protein